MSKHPVTPMDESDVRLHLGKQTRQVVDLIDIHDEQTQLAAGQKLQGLSSASLPFIVGSSGVEYALLKAMVASGEIEGRANFAKVSAVPQILTVSGSVSATTERQIKFALHQGFVGIEADPFALAQNEKREMDRLLVQAHTVLAQGKSPLVYTALGAGTDVSRKIDEISNGRIRIGQALGQMAQQCIKKFKLKRIIIAGGDTSSHALGEINIHALTTRHPLQETPGSPLCLAHSTDPEFDGLEIALKGGQVGGDDYFVKLRDGNFS
jgi:3-oxoisoapionate kinase